MNNFFNIMAYLSILLLIGIFIKSKVKIFQELFIPASVIGGVIGLLLSSEILGRFLTPEILGRYGGQLSLKWQRNFMAWEKILKTIPGVLIIPILVSLPLGMNLKKEKTAVKNALNMGGILFLVTLLQLFVGYFISIVFDKGLNKPLYKSFGSELNAGFAGGHGTAGIVAGTFKELGNVYWELAQGVTVTLATIGLVGGIIFGIYQIKMKKNTISDESLYEYKSGYVKNIEKQGNIGRETMLGTTIDTLAYHIAIIFGVSGISVLSLKLIQHFGVPIFSRITVWAYGMIIMSIVWKFIVKKKLDWSIDQKVKSKITATLTEFAIVATVATIPLKGVMEYLIPILILSIVGFFVTWILLLKLTDRYFSDHKFERIIAMFGTSTGVFITGVLLLKICDPELKTPVLQDYSFGFSIVALLGPILITLCIQLSFIYSYYYPIFLLGSLGILTVIVLEIYNRKKVS